MTDKNKHSLSWTESPDGLRIEIQFKDFRQAFSFMTEVALYAEKKDHHPEWTNTYNKVSIRLSTHSAGNTVTAKDRDLADVISQIYQRYS